MIGLVQRLFPSVVGDEEVQQRGNQEEGKEEQERQEEKSKRYHHHHRVKLSRNEGTKLKAKVMAVLF